MRKSFHAPWLVTSLAITALLGPAPFAEARTTAPQNAQAPSSDAINQAMKTAYSKYKDLKDGKNADYIPALAKVPSDQFGIVLVTTDGQIHMIGDVDKHFSIQSISKVFTLAEVFQEVGEQAVIDNIGVDATGDVFNSIVAIEKNKGKEMNPLVNPGAITTTSMVPGKSAAEKWAKIIGIHDAFAGRNLGLEQEVYESEAATNQRNQAIAMLMHAYERIKEEPKQATDLYTKQCSISVTAKDLAVMAATLANGGLNPVTGKQVIDQKHIKGLLSVMATAGLYDDAGQWLFASGLPAKSGVGGGLLAVSPGKFGIAVFSPRLDEAGNSVRGQKAIVDITARLGANPYDVQPTGPSHVVAGR
jgi:glutaminase